MLGGGPSHHVKGRSLDIPSPVTQVPVATMPHHGHGMEASRLWHTFTPGHLGRSHGAGRPASST